MSKRDLQRIEVLTEVLAGRRTTQSAAAVLDVARFAATASAYLQRLYRTRTENLARLHAFVKTRLR